MLIRVIVSRIPDYFEADIRMMKSRFPRMADIVPGHKKLP